MTRKEKADETLLFSFAKSAEDSFCAQRARARLRNRCARSHQGRTANARVPRAQPMRPGAGAGRRRAQALGVSRDPRIPGRKDRTAVANYTGRTRRCAALAVLSERS